MIVKRDFGCEGVAESGGWIRGSVDGGGDVLIDAL
jgi:hypothetical protein